MAVYRYYRNWEDSRDGAEEYALRGDEKPACLYFAEGLSESLFLEAWLASIPADPNAVAVLNFRGKRLSLVLRRLSEDENFPLVTRFGFFLDAEKGNADRKAQMVTAALKEVGAIPGGHRIRPGLLSDVAGKQIALFVSPDNKNPGYIENIVMKELAGHALFPCIEALEACSSRILREPTHAKALVQAFLGLMKPGLCGTGRGFEKQVLRVANGAYEGVRETLGSVL